MAVHETAKWTGDLSRARRLQVLQLTAVTLLGLGVVLASILFGSRILSSQRSVADDQRQARELHRLHGELRAAYATFLENRSQGRPGIDESVKQTFTRGLLDIRTLRARPTTDAQINAAIASVDQSLATLGQIINTDYSPYAIGSPQDQAALKQSVAAINQLDRAALAWATRASALADSHGRELQSLTRQLLAWLAAVVGLFGVSGVVTSALLARARTRIVDALFSEHAARGAVIASVQDGLAVIGPDGQITDMNDQLSTITGYTREQLQATTDTGVVPYLAGTDVEPTIVGERDLVIPRPDGEKVHVILSSSLLETPDGRADGRVHTLKDVTERKRAEIELRTLAMEQAALRRAATAVASGSPPDEVFAIVAREVALLLGATGGMVSRFDRTTHRAIRVGAWLGSSDVADLPRRIPLEHNVIASVYRNGTSARSEDRSVTPVDVFARHGFPVSISAPVRVGSDVWGAVTAASQDATGLPEGTEVRLARFAELVGITVANADARARLARQAATDALTGLANHRTFHERLHDEVAKAREDGTMLALAVFDLDHFKAVNDGFGHQVGDSVLSAFGRRLAAMARYGEIVARIGGEEFAWLLPGSDGPNAWRAAERVRQAYAAVAHPGVGHLTVSAGVCDLEHAGDADSLLRLADGALYWAKSHGRDNTTLYTPEVVDELSEAERLDRLTRTQAKTALRALARLIDTKDPATARHTERVAAMAAAIARRLGWAAERVDLLEEAALYHDVGKIGIPDSVMYKTGPLDPDERLRVRTHVALGAELVADVLQPEQVAWIRGHHENWDGSGYPDGLAASAIPDGALIIHLADAWDAMTSGRAYQEHRSFEDAVTECRARAGTQFSPAMVEVLLDVAAEQVKGNGRPERETSGDEASASPR